MPINKPRKLPEFLTGQNSALNGIISRGQHLHGLGVLLGELLGPDLATHCRLANIRGNTLILSVASTAWATRVRYQIPQLLQKIKLDGRLSDIRSIHVRITPCASPAETPRQNRRASISKTASTCLEQCAEGIDDPRLSSALRHLAKQKRSDT